ncbi:hypothetical protein MPTK1_4g16350 [Marchantia polymorpha subsp. ruderalis]|uniref:Uncharacterized protein n=2 Tax=Marchantia polymorpha TaxID=3197 RepID=A0AAF6BAH1_MARPO|nr:hypothetical protein MARPO_0054s0100 [Marchantia polymorpha]BBN09005.1 hypothetical protein Mp_4g16350 [Marchantia polymorpha subsp. ruderalis]|eukprot:PTQ37993.1 hypothetical protein MARPO_0054s0100 [Marchantia polymorpha]
MTPFGEHEKTFVDILSNDSHHENAHPGEIETGVGVLNEAVLLPHVAELEARATVKFDKSTFIKEQFYHNFFPLSIPVMYHLEGKKWGLINRGFLGFDRCVLMLSQWFLAANFYVLNVVSLAYVYKAKHLDYLYYVGLVDYLWFMRNMVVATKYAFLSKVEREEMKTRYVPQDVHDYRTLLRAWKDPIPGRVLKTELLLAAIRSKQALRKTCFSLDTRFDSANAIHDLILDLKLITRDDIGLKEPDGWLEILSQDLTKNPIAVLEAGGLGNVELLPVILYAAHVIHQASSLSRLKRIGHSLLSQHITACSLLLGGAHAVILTACRYIFGGHEVPGPSWTLYSVLIPGFVLMSFSMFSNVGFMMVGVLDFRRRHFIAESLDDLLRTSRYTGSHNARVFSGRMARFTDRFSWFRSPGNDMEQPSISRSSSSGKLSGEGIGFDFQDSESLLAWWACRQLLQNFGLGFYKRIKYYNTYFAVYCGVLLMFVVLKMLTGITKRDIYLLVTVLFSINVFLTLLALMVWPGGDTNYMLQHHGTTMINRKVRLFLPISRSRNFRLYIYISLWSLLGCNSSNRSVGFLEAEMLNSCTS